MTDLPLFPLHVVLFPGRPLPLHVFEARYRQMLADCMEADERFGVVAIQAGSSVLPDALPDHVPDGAPAAGANGAAAATFGVGTVAAITHVSELPDGRFDIVVRGVERFRIRHTHNRRPYLSADVQLLADTPPLPGDREQAGQLRALLLPYLRCLGAPDELLQRLPTEPDELAYLAASALHVELPDQQRLLELNSCTDRMQAVLAMVRREAQLIRHFGTVGSLRPVGPAGAQLN